MHGENLRKFTESRARAPRALCSNFLLPRGTVYSCSSVSAPRSARRCNLAHLLGGGVRCQLLWHSLCPSQQNCQQCTPQLNVQRSRFSERAQLQGSAGRYFKKVHLYFEPYSSTSLLEVASSNPRFTFPWQPARQAAISAAAPEVPLGFSPLAGID